MLKALCCIIQRDLRLTFRRRGECVMPLFFLVIVSSLFPMALGSDPKLLAQLAPAIIWVGVVLSLLMSLDRLFRSDAQAGILEQFVLSPYPLSLLMLGKSVAHGLVMGVPLLLLAPVLCLLLQGSFESLGVLWLSLVLGIPTLSLTGSVGAALTIGLREGGALLAIIILPLMIPIVIFGASAVTAANQGISYDSELLLLGALLLLAVVLGPVAISAALRASVTCV